MDCVGSRCRRDIHMVIKGHDVTCKERSTVCMQRREREVIWCGRDMDVTGAARDHQSKVVHVCASCISFEWQD